MPKIRVYELAKQLDVTNKDIIDKMSEYGKAVNNQLSSLEEADISRLTSDFKNKPPTPKAADVEIPKSGEAVPTAQPARPRPTDNQGRPVDAQGRPLRPRPRPQGEDGQPLRQRPRPVDAEGRPIRRPRPVDAQGRPVDAEGRPLRPRPRPVGEDGQPLQPRPRPVDAEVRPTRRPPPVDAQGRPVDAEGRPLRPRPRPVDEQGRPVRRPRPVGKDGQPLRPRPEGESQENKAAERPVAAETSAKENITPNTAATAQKGVTANIPAARPRDTMQERSSRPASDRPAQSRDTRRPQTGGGNRPAGTSSRPDGNRPYSGNRPSYTGTPQRDGRPAGTGAPRDGRPSGPRPAGGGSGRPGGPGRPGAGGAPGARPAAGGRPAPGGFGGRSGAGGATGAPGKKDTVKTEPSKQDRQAQYNKQRSSKTMDKRSIDRKEQSLEGGNVRVRNRPKTAPKRVMPQVERPVITMITVADEITVRDLAEKLYRSNADIIKVLMKHGMMVTANQAISFDTASMVAESFDVLVEEYQEIDVFEQAFSSEPEDEANLLTRPPVVVVMGHVDHGKTSLLDVIRNANVVSGEAGGITQHIGAYSVSINDKPITFLDTPGHEAFTAMRMRGAQVTDIAILVVAADDGVMPQTIEAINHAKAAGVEIIVAINKMDKPGANPDRIMQELTDKGLQPEAWGGTTVTVPVSALQKTGIDTLLEMIALTAELKELKANPNKPARGSIIEAKLDKGRGPVATILVQSGTLRVGDPIVAGSCFGKIRAMTDDKGRQLKEAGPSTPVEIIGLSEVPVTGDTFYAAENEKQARQLSESVVAKGRETLVKATQGKISLDDLFTQIQAGQVKDLNIVVKADVQGSVEALRQSLEKLSNDTVRVRIIHTGAGAITESDVMLASASNALIIGFNVRPEPVAKSVAEAEGVDIRMYSVIYSAIDDVAAAMKGMLDPEFREVVLGHAEIRTIFKASGVGTIAGSYVQDGKLTRNASVRLVRDGRVVHEGSLDSLKRFKDDVREVNDGYECGIVLYRYNDIKEGDILEAFMMEEIPR